MKGVNGTVRLAMILAAGILAACPGFSEARQTMVIGSVGVGYDFWDRSYDDEGDENLNVVEDSGDRREWGFRPEIELRSLGIHDTLSLRYAPVLIYDDLFDTTDVDHYLYLAGERTLTKDWTISLANDFVLSSDPTRYGATFFIPGRIEAPEAVEEPAGFEPAPDEITQDLGRRRYWTNNLVLGTTYTYAQDSDVGFGYGFRVLRNETDEEEITAEYDEYDRHEFSGLWSYRYNPAWRSSLNLAYIKGVYDDVAVDVPPELIDPEDPSEVLFVSQDLEEYRADVGLDYARSANDIFPLLYRFRGTEYEDVRRDTWAHEFSAGWDHAFDARTRLAIGAGPSYAEAEDLDGEWGYNAYLNFTRAYQYAEFRAGVSKGFITRNFTGSTDTGLTDLLEARLDLTYRFTPNLSSTIFGLYRDEEILNPQGQYFLSALGDRDPLTIDDIGDVTYKRDSYTLGASVSYTFWRWFVATLQYAYYEQDGDLMSDSYNDHRIAVLISASKELWRQ